MPKFLTSISIPTLVFLLFAPALSAGPGVAPFKIWELDGVDQSDRVTIFGMIFRSGDMTACPVPVYNGVPLSSSEYQSQVNTVHTDGSGTAKSTLVAIRHAITANQGKEYAFQPGSCNIAGYLDQSGILSFLGSTHNAQIVVTANGQTVTVDTKEMVTALSFSTCQLEYLFRGPIATVIKVQDCTSSTAYDFGWLYNGSTMGLNGGVPYATTSKIASLHPFFYLTLIPVLNIMEVRFDLENQWTDRGQDQVFDFSLKVGAANTTVYTKSAFKLIWRTHFTKVFTSGTEQGNVVVTPNFDYLISTKQYLNYDRSALVKSLVDPSTQYTAFVASDRGDMGGHAMMTQDYAGNEEGSPLPFEPLRVLYLADHATEGPATVNGRFRKAYAIWTGIAGKHPSNTLVGCVETVSGKGGGQGCGYRDVIMNVPYHLREGRSTGSYHWSGLESVDATPSDATGSTVSPVGKYISRHAHPTEQWGAGIYPAIQVGTLSTYNGWDYGALADHFQKYYSLSAVLSGDSYYLDQELDGAHALLATQNPNNDGVCGNGMFGNQSIGSASVRSMAWMFDQLQDAVSHALDGSIEKLHLTTQMNSNLAMLCGFMKLTCPGITAAVPNYSCSSYSCATANRSAFGRCSIGQNVDPTGSHSLTHGVAPPDGGDAITLIKPANLAGDNGGATDLAEGFFDAQAYIVLHKGIDMGFTQFTAVAMEASKLAIRRALDPAYNIYLTAVEGSGIRAGANTVRSGIGTLSNTGTTFTRLSGDNFDSVWTNGTVLFINGYPRTLSVGGSTSVVTLASPACFGLATSITGATHASPIVITANGHTATNGTSIYVYGVLGNTAANGSWVAASVTANTIALTGSTGNGAYTSGGVVQLCPDNDKQFSFVEGAVTVTTSPYITDMATMLATHTATMQAANSLADVDFPCSADHSYSLMHDASFVLSKDHGVAYNSYTGALAHTIWRTIFPFFGGGMCGGSPGNIGDIQLKFALAPRDPRIKGSVSGAGTFGGGVVH